MSENLPAPKPDLEKDAPFWIPVEQAANELGVPLATIIAWISEGSIVSQAASGSDGVVAMVRRAEVEKRAKRAEEERTAALAEEGTSIPGSELAPLLKSLPDLIRDLVEAKERAAKAETKLEFLNERLKEVRSERDELRKEAASRPPETPAASPARKKPVRKKSTRKKTVRKPPSPAEQGADDPVRVDPPSEERSEARTQNAGAVDANLEHPRANAEVGGRRPLRSVDSATADVSPDDDIWSDTLVNHDPPAAEVAEDVPAAAEPPLQTTVVQPPRVEQPAPLPLSPKLRYRRRWWWTRWRN